jgi:RimJ/RimL family protein N-acetyltransferase
MTFELDLRPLTIDDIDDEYCSWYENNDGHLDYFTGSGRKFNRDTLIEDYRKGVESGYWYYFVVEDADSFEKIGNVKIGPIDKKNRTSDLVCFIGKRSYLGKGLAPIIISMANKIAFEKFDIRRLHSGMYSTNVASIKAYTRAGWKIEACFKGYYMHEGKQIDRICVCCLNPKYFPEEKIEK